MRECGLWKPDRIWKPDDDLIARRHHADRPEHGIAKTTRPRLHHVSDRNTGVLVAEIFHDVGLSRPDHEADAVGAALDHPLEEILAHRTRALDTILGAATDR